MNFDETLTAGRNTDSGGLTQTIESKNHGEARMTRPGICELCGGIQVDNMGEVRIFVICRNKRHSEIRIGFDNWKYSRQKGFFLSEITVYSRLTLGHPITQLASAKSTPCLARKTFRAFKNF